MPKIINFTTPPFTRGNAEEQIKQLHSWLFKTIEQLNVAFDNMGTESSQGQVIDQQSIDDLNSQREALKQLVVRTAGTLREEMQAAAPRSGTVTSGALAGGAYEDIDISFGEELPVVPVVTLSLAAPAAFTAGGACCYTIAGSVTTTGFKMRIANASSDTTAHSFTAMWIAAV